MRKKPTDPDLPISPSHGEYEYVSAGIKERPGKIPIWLLIVIIGLFIWGTYYLATYWGPQ